MAAISRSTALRWLRPLTLGAALAVLLVAAAPLWLPGVIQRQVPALLQRWAPQVEVRMEVRRVGWQGADIHRLAVGPPEQPGLTADLLRMDYRPSDLRHPRLRNVSVSGLTLRLEKSPHGIRLPGLYPLPTASRGASAASDWGIDRLQAAAARLGTLDIRHATLEIHSPEGLTALPFAARLASAPDGRLQGTVQLALGSAVAHLEVLLAREATHILLTLDARVPELAVWNALLQAPVALQGDGHLTACVRLDPSHPALASAEGHLRLERGRIGSGPMILQALDSPESAGTNLDFRFKGLSNKWSLEASPFLLGGPIGGVVRHLSALFSLTDDSLTASGGFALDTFPPWEATLTGAQKTRPFGLRADWQGQLDAGRSWELELSVEPDQSSGQPQRLNWPHGEAQAVEMVFHGKAAGRGNAGQADLSLRLGDLHGRYGGTVLQVPRGESALAVRWDDAQTMEGDFRVLLHGATGQTATVAWRAPRLALEGRFAGPSADNPAASGRLDFEGLHIQIPAADIAVQDISGSLPLAWPPPGKAGTRGELQASLRWRQNLSSRLQGSVWQSGEGLNFQGRALAGALPGLQLDAIGRLAIATPLAARLEGTLRQTTANLPIDLGALLPAMEGWSFQGQLGGAGHWDQIGLAGAGQAELEIENGRLEHPGRTPLGVEGLQLNLTFPDLPRLRSAPRQSLGWSRAYAGDLNATGGQAFFQVEPGPALFLEDARFQWCEGTVQVAATRIDPTAPSQEIILIGDRLKLVPLLAQFGVARAEGQGSVSGRVPLQISGGQIVFSDGFLYSAPGEGGTIRLEAADFLSAGGLQGSQIDLARHALQDYDYQWAKLNLTSEGENLLLKLQLDGKPARSLPFVYDPARGGLVPAPPGHPGSTFQGIRLDVNFRLPLNRLLQYKDILKSLP
jgi:hypothetical protein